MSDMGRKFRAFFISNRWIQQAYKYRTMQQEMYLLGFFVLQKSASTERKLSTFYIVP